VVLRIVGHRTGISIFAAFVTFCSIDGFETEDREEHEGKNFAVSRLEQAKRRSGISNTF
jgi:hypothetical protein